MADYRCALATRLRDRADQLGAEIFDRIWHLEDGPNLQPPRTFDGLRPLIRSLVEYGAAAIELGERQCPPPPPAVLEHSRKVAWAAGPDRLLHDGYVAARTVFDRFLRREAPSVEGYRDATFSQIQDSTDIVFERLVRLVGEEFELESEKKRCSPATQRLKRVKALLAGRLIEAPDLGYELSTTHIGLVGRGENLGPLFRDLARSLGGRLLLVEPSPETVWAWIGTGQTIPLERLEGSLEELPATLGLAVGDSATGRAGWQRTHEQAGAAFRIATRMPGSAVYYANVDLMASIARDDLMRTNLQRTYLEPLNQGQDGGQALRETLRVYLDAGQKALAASPLLGVTRQTVSNRIQKAEKRLGFSLSSQRALLLHIALQLDELGFFGSTRTHLPNAS